MTRVKSPYIASHTCCANSECMFGGGAGGKVGDQGETKNSSR